MKSEDLIKCLMYYYRIPKCELIYNKDYEFLISVMLSAQTTDKMVNIVAKNLFEKYNTLEKLSNANVNDVKNIIRAIGNYSKKADAVIEISKILINKHNCIVPSNRQDLESMPMVGRKTTNVVLSVLFNIPNIAVDTHVERVSKRLGLVSQSDNVIVIEKKLKQFISKDKWNYFSLATVLFGRYYCKAIKPSCYNCKFLKYCTYKKSITKVPTIKQ